MGKITKLEHLAASARAAKTFTSGLVSEMAQAAAADIADVSAQAAAAKAKADSADKLATARTVQIGSAAKTFDGSADSVYTLDEIGVNGCGVGNIVRVDATVHTEGSATSAISPYAHAEGIETVAGVLAEEVPENNTDNTGDGAHAEGYQTIAKGRYSHAEGRGSTATGQNTHSEGYGTQAIAQCSHAEGKLSKAFGDQSHAEGYSTQTFGHHAHAEGNNTIAGLSTTNADGTVVITGDASHAEGYKTKTTANCAHAEGELTTASGADSHAEGRSTKASGNNAHAEGELTTASGADSHAEGKQTTASGNNSHAEGYKTVAAGFGAHAKGNNCVASGAYSYAEGYQTLALSEASTCSGYQTITINGRHALKIYGGSNNSNKFNVLNSLKNLNLTDADDIRVGGFATVVVISDTINMKNTTITGVDLVNGIIEVADNFTFSGPGMARSYLLCGDSYLSDKNQHSEGNSSVATGNAAHAEGFSTYAIGGGSHAEGWECKALGHYSHAEGCNTIASGNRSHAEGDCTIASGYGSHANGWRTIANTDRLFVVGQYNKESNPNSEDMFIVGSGVSDENRSNAFRVSRYAVFGKGAFNSTGADYAELMEWQDGNPNVEDRCGKFVTVVGDKIKIASPADDVIMGIISGDPSVVGDVHDDQWSGMYMTDVFGRPLWEDVEVPAETEEMPDPENSEKTITRVIIPAHMEHRQKVNPDFDNSQPYEPRTKRQEWDAVGMLGKLVAVDDGTCIAGGYCTVGDGGVATASESKTKYYVMKRLDESHIKVLIF